MPLILTTCSLLSKSDQQCGIYKDSVSQLWVSQFPDEPPAFQDGEISLSRYFYQNFSMSSYDSTENFIATFKIQLIINRKGHVLASRILGKEKEQLTKLEISVLNLFDNMPKWNPGKCNGVAVNCLYQTVIRI